MWVVPNDLFLKSLCMFELLQLSRGHDNLTYCWYNKKCLGFCMESSRTSLIIECIFICPIKYYQTLEIWNLEIFSHILTTKNKFINTNLKCSIHTYYWCAVSYRKIMLIMRESFDFFSIHYYNFSTGLVCVDNYKSFLMYNSVSLESQ